MISCLSWLLLDSSFGELSPRILSVICCQPWFLFDNAFRELSFMVIGSVGFHSKNSFENYPFRLLPVLHLLILSLVSCLPGFSFASPFREMVNGLHLYSTFIQSAVQLMHLIHPFTHTFTHQQRLAAMQGTNQLVRSNWGLGVLLKDTSTCPGWDRTGNPPTARRQLLPPEPYSLRIIS